MTAMMNAYLADVDLLHAQGMDDRSIAEKLNISEGMVHKAVYRNEIDRRIWSMQDQGASDQEIVEQVMVSTLRIAQATQRRKDTR